MQLAPLCNSRCGQRTLQAWPGRYGAFFLAPIPFCLARKKKKNWLLCRCLIEFTKTGLMSVFACGSWRLLCFQVWDISMSSRDVFVFMGCLWGGPGSDFLVLLWSCPPNSYAVTVPRTGWSLVPQRWWGIWVVYPFLQIGCVVVTVSTSFCLAGCVALMLFTIS